MYTKQQLFYFITTLFTFSACSSNEIGDSKDVAQDKIYQHYYIEYTEGNADVSIESQFRFAGRNGTTLVLNAPSQVEFDAQKLAVDSSAGAGAYYNSKRAATGFYGRHHFVFTTTDNKKFENDLSFDKFKLSNVPVEISAKQAFNLNFETTPLQEDDYIELATSNSDSSFHITHYANDKGNYITIPVKQLQRQNQKELLLQTTLYRKIPLQQSTGEGGEIKIKYTLKPVRVKLDQH